MGVTAARFAGLARPAYAVSMSYLSLTTGSGPSAARMVPYLMISVTTPEPTVRPPSRIANRRPGSMAIG